MSTEIKLKGFEAIEAMFNRLPDDIAGDTAKRALKDGANVVLEEAQNLVPEGDTGKLADSLSIKFVKGSLPTYRVYAKRSKGMGGWHANLVEYGTAPHMIGNIAHPGMAPKPFMRPALLTKKDETLKAVFEKIYKHCQNAIKKASK